MKSALLNIVVCVSILLFSLTLGAVNKFYESYYTIENTNDFITALSQQGVIRKHAYIEYYAKLLIPTGLGYEYKGNGNSKLFYISELNDEYVYCLLDNTHISDYSADISDYHIKGITRKFTENELALIEDILVEDYNVPTSEVNNYTFEYMIDSTEGNSLFFVRLQGLILLSIVLFIIGINVLEVKKCIENKKQKSRLLKESELLAVDNSEK